MNNGLHAWPNTCLISNRGFDSEGTHTFGESEFASPELHGLGDIVHPEFVLPCRETDKFAFFHRRGGQSLIERDRYGHLYAWLLRFRGLKSEGLTNYLISRFKWKLAGN